LTRAYGISAFRAASENEFNTALDKSLKEIARGNTAFIETTIGSNEMVLPMVVGGKPVDDKKA
jgi:thiamine pyrophosphate-dependent acetolactate synthase large subunit-like protein